MAKATGEYITFLDGDDLYHPEKLARQLSVFKAHPEVSLVFHETKLFHQDLEEQPGIYYAGRVNFLERAKDYMDPVEERIYLCKENYYNFMSLECNVFLTCAVMFPRQLLEKEKVWFPEIELGEDTDLWFRLVKGRRLAFIDETLAYYRQVPGSQSSLDDRRARMLVLVMSENLKRGWELFNPEERKRYHQKIAEDYFNLGYLFHQKGQGREARKAYRQAFSMNPKFKTVKAYMATFLSGRKG